MLNMNIRKIAVVLSIVFGLSAMTVWGNTETGSAEGKTIRVAAQSYPLYSPINAAYELGYFDEEFEAIGASYTWTEFASKAYQPIICLLV